MTTSRPVQGGSPGTWGTQLDAYLDQFVDSSGALVPAAVRTALGGSQPAVGNEDKPFILVGGDHPYAQWGSNGMAQAYFDKGLRAYIAVNSDATGVTPGNTDMLSWAQLANLTALKHQILAHGARHIQDWTRINTGIKIIYAGANGTATVTISATQIVCTAGADSVTVNLSGNTLAQVQTAINATTGWTCTLAPELTGSEQSLNLLQIGATSVKNITSLFAAGGGITVLLTSTTYRHAYVQVAGGTTLKLWGDGRLLLSQAITGGATLNTIVTAINAVSGFTAALCDNQKAQTSSFESYVSGSELAVSLALLSPGASCVGYPAILQAGLPRWYMIERQLQRNVDQAAANGYTLTNFASSGASFVQNLPAGHTQFRTFRGNQLGDIDTNLPAHVAFPAFAMQQFRPVTSLTLAHCPTSSGRLPALVSALADSPGFIVDALMHKVLADGSSGYSFPSTDNSFYDQTETDFIAYLNALQAQVSAGAIVNLLPSEVAAAAAGAQRPRNYLFNPKFRNSGEALAGVAASNVYIIPGWGLLTPGSDQSAVSVDSNFALNVTTATASAKFPVSQLIYLEPGKTYEMGLLVEISNYTAGSGVSMRVSTLRGWQRNDGYNQSRVSVSRFASTLIDHLRMTFTVPSPEEFQRPRIISSSFGAGINMSTNKNIKLKFYGKTLDNLDLSAGAALNTSVQAPEAAAAINAALLAAAKAQTIGGEFLNLARSENNQLIIEMPLRGPDGSFSIAVNAATSTDISATVFGSVDSFAAAEFASAQDGLLLPLKFEIGHTLAIGTSFKVSRPYIQELIIR